MTLNAGTTRPAAKKEDATLNSFDDDGDALATADAGTA